MTLEQGKPLAESKGEVLHSADTFEWFAEEGKRAYGQVIPHREQGKRLIAVKFSVRNRDLAGAVAEAQQKTAQLFRAPYRAEWSGEFQEM